MGSIKHIAFDMDGVIYSAEEFIAEAYETAIKNSKLNLAVPGTDEILKQIGKPVSEIFLELFGEDLSDEDSKKLLTQTRKSIVEMIKAGKGEIYDGIKEIISSLSKQYELSVCSNAGIVYIETILEHYGLKNFFRPVYTLETKGVRNKKDLLSAYIADSNLNSAAWVMIGDRTGDLEAARHNYCAFIGCMWGHGDVEELEGSDLIIESPESLPEAIKKLG